MGEMAKLAEQAPMANTTAELAVREKVVVITGAARGIGQEFARSLAAAGAYVVAADMNDCSATIESITAGNGKAIGIALDVRSARSASDMISAAIGAFGHVDALINNAALYGALRGGRFDAIAEADWDAAMAVNVKGIWNCCKAAVPAMRQAGGGSIINLASLAATYGMPFALHYTTSKAAVIGLTRGLARELGRDSIRVNALAPSAVLTDGTREFFGDKAGRALEVIKAGQSIQRNLTPPDLVGAVVWLVSDASRFVTGQTIAIDGGTVML
jgi:p-cumic alcohol dehydrogenase